MQTAGETVFCEILGNTYEYDGQRRCWKCDGASCPQCLPDGVEELCPECRFGPLPVNIEPMLAKLGAMPKDLENWSFEYKWDGMRALTYLASGRMRIESRNLRDITGLYPDIAGSAEGLPGISAIFDGEIVAFDDKGRPDFKRLQRRMHLTPDKAPRMVNVVPVKYFVFDLLWLDGKTLMDLPYSERRARLDELALNHPRWQNPAANRAEGPAMLKVAKQWGLEGLMAKRIDSPYLPGVRNNDWRKIKIVKRTEFVIGGWEPREKNPGQIGALLLGYYDPESLELNFAGRVGTGFNAQMHEKLTAMLAERETGVNPFAGSPGKRETRYVKPDLVADVGYRRWPGGGSLQQASFHGLRTDMPAAGVVIRKEG